MKEYFKWRMQIVLKDPNARGTKDVDYNQINEQIIVGQIVHILQLVIYILNIAYFMGFLWYIYCELVYISV